MFCLNKQSCKHYLKRVYISINRLITNRQAKRMKLGIGYNIFDGEELLESSLKSVRNCAKYICVVYQRKSYYGNNGNPNIEEQLKFLKEKGLIDEIYLYDKDCSKISNKRIYEREKRTIALNLARKRGMTHFLSMDVDEFYDCNQINNIKAFIIQNKIHTSACSVQEYLKLPIYKMVSSYTFQLTDDYNFYVPFIMKIHKFKKQHFNQKLFYTLIDPSRGLNNNEKFYLFPRQKVLMHHMSTVRKDLNVKYTNSNYNNSGEKIIEKCNAIKNSVINWNFEDNQIYDTKYAIFDNKLIEKVENKFNINLEDFT